MKETFQGGPGKVHPKQRRTGGLPSDLTCSFCNEAIPNDEACYEFRKGFNSYGEYTALETPKRKIVCVGCVE